MTPSSLRAGKTYVGTNGRRRYLTRLSRGDAIYDRVDEGGSSFCLAWTFARWAEREATDEESVPPTGEEG